MNKEVLMNLFYFLEIEYINHNEVMIYNNLKLFLYIVNKQ